MEALPPGSSTFIGAFGDLKSTAPLGPFLGWCTPHEYRTRPGCIDTPLFSDDAGNESALYWSINAGRNHFAILPFIFYLLQIFCSTRHSSRFEDGRAQPQKEENYLIFGGLVLVFIGIVGQCFLSGYSSHTEYLMHLEPSIP